METVLITGANKGIGFETARELAQLGYFVYLGSRSRMQGLDALHKLKTAGINNAAMIAIDVTSIPSIKRAKQELENQTAVLDVLINNAGIAGAQLQNMSSGEMENLRKVFETNFFGAVQTTQQFLSLLRKSGNPRIINVSSELGSLALHSRPAQNPNWNKFDAYSCSKTALNAFTVMLAREFRDTNFRIQSIAPGYTATALNGFKGTQTAAQAAQFIVKGVTSGNESVTGKFFKEEEVPW